MRFLHLAPGYAPYAGGMPKAAQQAAEGFVQRGHEVVLVTPAHQNAPAQEEINGVRVRRLFCWPRTKIAGWPWGFAKLWKQDWDAVVLHMPFFGMQEWLLLVMLLVKKKTQAQDDSFAHGVSRGAAKCAHEQSCACVRRPRLIVWYHMDIMAKGWIGIVATIARRTSTRWLLHRADTILVASDSYARTSWLKDVWQEIEQKVVIQSFGVDMQRFTPTVMVETAPKRIVFVGGLDAPHYFKGVPVLLRACARLRHREDWILDIVGDGSLRKEYELLARELGLQDRVRFFGRLATGLEKVYQSAWIHVLPSLDRSEAFGLVSLEAGASGVPSMVSDLPGVRDAIVPGKTGWCVKVGDESAWAQKMESVLDMPLEHRLTMGKAAREWVEKTASLDAYVGAIERASRCLSD